MNTAKETAKQLFEPGYWDTLNTVLLPIVGPIFLLLLGGYIIMILVGVYQYKQELKRFYGTDECGE